MNLRLDCSEDMDRFFSLVDEWWYDCELITYDRCRRTLEVILAKEVRCYGVYASSHWLIRMLHARYRRQIVRVVFFAVNDFEFIDPYRVESSAVGEVALVDGCILISGIPASLRINAEPPFAVECGEPAFDEASVPRRKWSPIERYPE